MTAIDGVTPAPDGTAGGGHPTGPPGYRARRIGPSKIMLL
jgi:hypothetical protein